MYLSMTLRQVEWLHINFLFADYVHEVSMLILVYDNIYMHTELKVVYRQ